MHTQQHNFHSPLRYPGGKGALANFIKLVIAQNKLLDGDYVEVYAGGAGIAWSLLFEEYVRCVHVNDLNKALMAFWYSVLEDTDELCRLVRDTEVTIEEWLRQRAIQTHLQDRSRLEIGFSTFFLNRTNRSGILNGGVIGGQEQAGEWRMDARFNKQDLIRRIQRIAQYANRIKLYNLDAADFIERTLPNLPQNTLVYLDPPYFKKGQELYENHYHQKDHAEIATLVSNSIRQPWLVSYDNEPAIMSLYEEHRCVDYAVDYSAQTRYKGSEVIFHSSRLHVPQVDNPVHVRMPHF
jgi:DNA adenine methylase